MLWFTVQESKLKKYEALQGKMVITYNNCTPTVIGTNMEYRICWTTLRDKPTRELIILVLEI